MTDQYAVVEGAVMTKLRTLTALFPKASQVTDNDAELNTGADYWAIFQPGAFPNTRVDGHTVDVNWQIIFDLYVRYKTRKESLPKFKAARSEVFNLLHPASINSTAGVSKLILSASGGLQQDAPGDNPNFLIQTFSCIVTQRVHFNF
jgi:hypothetical protein